MRTETFPSVPQRLAIAAKAQARVIGALILRDMRTRFGRTHLSYIIQLLWPLVHMMIIYTAFVWVDRAVPLGGSSGIYIATGCLPYILVLYPARMMTLSILQNGQALVFPVVKTPDIIIARAIVEFVSAWVVVIAFVLILLAMGESVAPQDWGDILAAVLCSMYLGLGLGVLNVIMMTLFRFWLIAFVLTMSILYLTAGINSVQLFLPPAMREWLWYNPVAQVVGWMRTAYFGEYSEFAISHLYVLAVASVSFLLGMLGDRLLRGRILGA